MVLSPSPSGRHGLSPGVVAAVVLVSAHREHRPAEATATLYERGRDGCGMLRHGHIKADGNMAPGVETTTVMRNGDMLGRNRGAGGKYLADASMGVAPAGLVMRPRQGMMRRRDRGEELIKGGMILAAADGGGAPTMVH